MLNIIEEKIDAVRQVAREQTNRVCNELNVLADHLQKAEVKLDTALRAGMAKREEAAKLEEQALREHSTAIGNILASAIEIVKQLDDGMMVTGSTDEPQRRPKIRAVAGE